MGADKIPAGSMKKIEFSGYFDMYKLYDELTGFLENARNYDITEKYYTEKNDDGKKELSSYFDGELHYTDYYQLILVVKVVMKGVDTVVEINGKKKTLAKGKVKLIASRYIEVDFLNKRSKSPLMEFATKVYDKYFGSDEIVECSQIMSRDIASLKTIVKNHVLLIPESPVPGIENE
jgi:hypothetical protein